MIQFSNFRTFSLQLFNKNQLSQNKFLFQFITLIFEDYESKGFRNISQLDKFQNLKEVNLYPY